MPTSLQCLFQSLSSLPAHSSDFMPSIRLLPYQVRPGVNFSGDVFHQPAPSTASRTDAETDSPRFKIGNKKKGLVAGTDGDEGNRADAAGYREPQGVPLLLCEVGRTSERNLDRTRSAGQRGLTFVMRPYSESFPLPGYAAGAWFSSTFLRLL
ncbi:hypothetical protein VNO80_15861 [Phaseolus coccineus]|uniref:Uncharacterized protein n=1 Tax=Phaseolus coccineus TaxID=3886 RepID=A0AAN9R2N6_PHACN